MKFQPKSEKEIAEAGLFANGEYDFEVMEATETNSKAGNDMIELVMRVYNSDGGYTRVMDWLVSIDSVAYKIRHFAATIGMIAEYEKGELKADKLVGKVGRCKLVIKKDKTGEYPDKNGIADYIKPAEGAAPVQARKPVEEELDDQIPF